MLEEYKRENHSNSDGDMQSGDGPGHEGTRPSVLRGASKGRSGKDNQK